MTVARQRGHQGTALADILKPDNVEQLLSDPTVVERLLPHLPEGANRTASDVRTSIRSPQYSQVRLVASLPGSLVVLTYYWAIEREKKRMQSLYQAGCAKRSTAIKRKREKYDYL